ncbi:MAG: hypothetical protein ACT4TC_03280 [Myxococcaceae bacterium]
MTANGCPELEALFNDLAEGQGPALEHAQDCVACSALLEEHRQLEKDLFRLADPLPPANFVHSVMAKVDQAPLPVRHELRAGFAIVASALVAAAAAFGLSHGNIALLSAGAASAIVGLQSFVVGSRDILSIIWKTAAVPASITLTLFSVLSLVFLKRLTTGASLTDAEVSS